MSTEEETDTGQEAFGSGTMNPIAANLLDQIGDAIEEAARDQHLDLAIPGTNDLLWARYRPFPVARTEAKQEQMRKAIERGRPIMLQAACDTLVDACEQIMVLPPQFDGDAGEDGENLVPIDDTIPVTFELRLAQIFLGKKQPELVARLKTSREVVLALYPTEQSIIAQNVEVSNWMTNVNKRVSQEAVGE
jgi:hypothetical protein